VRLVLGEPRRLLSVMLNGVALGEVGGDPPVHGWDVTGLLRPMNRLTIEAEVPPHGEHDHPPPWSEVTLEIESG
jgi:hypothetical protein